MRAALRSIAAVLAGFIAASVVMLVVETINGRLFYPELAKAAEGLTDRDAIRELLATAPRNASINLSAGLGVVTFQDESGLAWFKGGHNDWTGNMVVCLERGQRCVVMLSNDARAERIFPELTHAILGNTRMPWTWEYDWLEPSRR